MKEIIEPVISNLLKTNGFVLMKEEDSSITYPNKKCILYFYKEYGDVYLYIINPLVPNEEFHIGVLLDYLFNISLDMFGRIYNPDDRIKQQLLTYAHNIESKLANVLNGDFSWSQQYFAFENQQNDLLRRLNNLPGKHPTYQKFKNNDPTWKNDILNLD